MGNASAMQQPRPIKFNFDNVFGDDGSAQQPVAPRARSTYSVDEVETIRRETLVLGKVDAEAQAAAARAAALGEIAQGLKTVMATVDAAILTTRQESALVALAVGHKLAESALAAFPLKEIEALVADCLQKLHREPRLVVRVSPGCAEAIRAEIDAVCEQQGYAGRLIVIAEPSLTGADCHVEWADGGIERDLAATFAAIEQTAERWRTTTSAEEN